MCIAESRQQRRIETRNAPKNTPSTRWSTQLSILTVSRHPTKPICQTETFEARPRRRVSTQPPHCHTVPVQRQRFSSERSCRTIISGTQPENRTARGADSKAACFAAMFEHRVEALPNAVNDSLHVRSLGCSYHKEVCLAVFVKHKVSGVALVRLS